MSRQLSVKNPYETLKKLKKSALVVVRSNETGSFRMRLLDIEENHCGYTILHFGTYDTTFDLSCFWFIRQNWKTNINAMQNFDKMEDFTIVEIIEL